MYWRIGNSRVVHKINYLEIPVDCHYFMRQKDLYAKKSKTKPRGCSWCDECGRLEKKARATVKRPKP
jgi:hypothetical protein